GRSMSSVPPQPVPPLSQTLSRYLRALEPLVTPPELEESREGVQELSKRGGLGERLQRSLEKRAQRTHNWCIRTRPWLCLNRTTATGRGSWGVRLVAAHCLSGEPLAPASAFEPGHGSASTGLQQLEGAAGVSDWWQHTAYLESRLPLPVHSNPAMALPQQDYSNWKGQLGFAAKLIAGVLDFKAKIDNHTLLVEYLRGRPLCMDQYRQIFSSCRVPGPKHDHVMHFAGVRRPPTHITVVRNFQIHSQLLRIRSQSWKTDKEPMGILTSEHRNTWGQAYNTLLRGTVCIHTRTPLMYGCLCSTCESASLRMFRGGRTDTIRSATNEALRFVEVMEDPQAGAEMKLALLKEAIEAHSTYTEQALQGQAIDRHLLGLKLQAIEEGLSMPEIFMDTSYAMATHWKLHTGQVSARTDCVMCFGPMVPDGYAVCYNPLPEHINFSVSAFNCCAETNADKLAGSLKQALRDLQELVLPRED
ncbi:UNVERIFIED_CONTAM: hypothetical protein FKN15_069202, partial [Acipenser sinensis]